MQKSNHLLLVLTTLAILVSSAYDVDDARSDTTTSSSTTNMQIQFLESATAEPVTIYNSTASPKSNYQQGYNPLFRPQKKSSSCQSGGIYLSTFNAQQPQNFLRIENKNTQQQIIIEAPLKINVKSSAQSSEQITVSSTFTTPQYINPDSQINIAVTNQCPPESAITNANYWSLVEMSIVFAEPQQTVAFQYIVACQLQAPAAEFNYSLLILVIASSVIVYAFASFQKIGGFKTQFFGYSIRWWFVFFYVAAFVVSFLFLQLDQTAIEQIVISICMPLSLGCGYFIFNELLAKVPSRARLTTYLVPKIKMRYQDILAAALSIAMIVWYWLSAQAYYVNDLLALFLIATMIKGFKFTSMREATIFLSACLLTDLVTVIAVHETQKSSYNTLVLRFFSCPLELQLPSIPMGALLTNCVWLPTTGLIIPGFFIAYSIRFDKSEMRQRNSIIYQVLSLAGFSIGSLLWLTVASFEVVSLPFATFSYPIMLLLTGFVSWQRCEFDLFWTGSFHDNELLENIIKQRYVEDSDNLEVASRGSWKERVFTGLSYQETLTKRISQSQTPSFENNFRCSTQHHLDSLDFSQAQSGGAHKCQSSQDMPEDCAAAAAPINPSNLNFIAKFLPDQEIIEELVEREQAGSKFDPSLSSQPKLMGNSQDAYKLRHTDQRQQKQDSINMQKNKRSQSLRIAHKNSEINAVTGINRSILGKVVESDYKCNESKLASIQNKDSDECD